MFLQSSAFACPDVTHVSLGATTSAFRARLSTLKGPRAGMPIFPIERHMRGNLKRKMCCNGIISSAKLLFSTANNVLAITS